MKKFKPKEILAVGLPAASLAVSSANYVTNSKKRQENKEYQERQIQVLDKLTDSIKRVDDTLAHLPQTQTVAAPKEKKKRGFRFFQKSNSHTSDLAFKGGAIGGVIAGGAVPFLPPKIGKSEKSTVSFRDKKGNMVNKTETRVVEDNSNGFKSAYNKTENLGLRQALITLGGIAVGATLGALVGAIMDTSSAISRKSTVNKRLMEDIMEALKKSGYKDGIDYTRDMRKANLMKTKVCLVISRSADTLKLLINTVNDPKLKSLSGGIIKNLPSMSTVTEKASDKFNELNVTTMTTNNGDATWVSSVASRFIAAGYPVYLVEVG